MAEIAPGVIGYSNAAGANDIEIRVEDPLPIAKYQPIGKLPEPFKGSASISEKLLNENKETETTLELFTNGTEENKETAIDDKTFIIDEVADSYQWYILSGETWEKVNGATDSNFIISSADFETYDIRCVYTVNDVEYSTNSAKGLEYVRYQEENLEPIPDDIELNPEPTYSLLEMNKEDPYLGYVFSVTFAEDEWVKEIKVNAPDDDISEAIKAGYFTIIDCEGGELYDTANTLALAIEDDEDPEPCELGFETSIVDRKSVV